MGRQSRNPDRHSPRTRRGRMTTESRPREVLRVPTPPGNRWDDLELPPLGSWTPKLTVSVLVPAYANQDVLDRTLAALAAQSYPSELLEVVVVDDGSEPPLQAPRHLGQLKVRVVHQERAVEFGAGRARNRAAREAHGEVLLFLDSDMVGEHRAIEAHARWHHLVDDAVTMGFTRFVELSDLPSERVQEFVANDTLAQVLAGRPYDEQEWRERRLTATAELTRDRSDLFGAVVSSNLGLRSELFHEVGGFRVLGIRGAEDIELGYRLYVDGALLVPDREARFWHQGRRFFDSGAADGAKRRRAPVLERFIPVAPFRAPQGSSDPEAVPVVKVVADVSDWSPSEVTGFLKSAACTRYRDASFIVVGAPPELQPSSPRLRVEFVDDPPALDTMTPIPIQMRVNEPVVLGRYTIGDVARRLQRQPVGRLEVLSGDRKVADVYLTRALRRAARARPTSDGVSVSERAAELFSATQIRADAVTLEPATERALAQVDRRASRPAWQRAVHDRLADARRAGWRATAKRYGRAFRRRLGRLWSTRAD